MHSICQIAMLVVVMSGSCGCIPFYGDAKASVGSEPVRFVDATSGQTLSEVLVIPRYTSYSGIALWGAGHGPSAGTDKIYVAHPFRYRDGDRFTPDEPKTFALGGPGVVWILSGTTVDGVVIVAPGYAPVWVDNFWGDQRHWELAPLSPPDSLHELVRLRELLSRTQLDRIEDYGLWSLGNNYNLEIRFSQSERQQVITFLDDAIARLEASNPAQRTEKGLSLIINR
jgi:hypothetical protein